MSSICDVIAVLNILYVRICQQNNKKKHDDDGTRKGRVPGICYTHVAPSKFFND